MKTLRISTKNSEYQIIESLKRNRAKRNQYQEAFVEGTESIKQVLNAGLEITRIVVQDGRKLSDWGIQVVQGSSARIIEMSSELYQELCDREEPSEMLITVKITPLQLSELKLTEKPFLLIFDRPSDYGNFGSIVRSANSFNVDGVLLLGHGIDPYDPKVIRSSLGSIFHTQVVHLESMQILEDWLKQQKESCQLNIVGTDSTGSISLSDQPLKQPIALILGNEAKGMSVALKNLSDFIISIPISGAVNSLNVACAGSILLWEVFRNDDQSLS